MSKATASTILVSGTATIVSVVSVRAITPHTPLHSRLQEVIDLQQTEDESHRLRDVAVLSVVDEAGLGQLPGAAARLELAAALRQHVAHPLRVAPVGEGEGELSRLLKNVDRRAVGLCRSCDRCG